MQDPFLQLPEQQSELVEQACLLVAQDPPTQALVS
jgi:hypothetical protein